ncbi:GNAT family N-acetyltransferase [Caballeronia catudaia]|nr:GNAT family N-acetyltransferase [Caballeronia catudaia]
MKRRAVISSGSHVFDLLSDSLFLQRWFDLYRACPWATVYQASDFVKTWYESYGNQFSPIIVTMEGQQGELCGLLTLAANRSTGRLAYAGDVLSEYQVWLAREEVKDVFMPEALKLIGKEFTRQVLRLKFLPPGTHLGPLEKTNWVRNISFLSPSSRPLIGANDEQRIDQSLKSKKVKLNRLKRLGTVSFRQVTRDEFPDIFEQAWPLFEFRQIDQFNSSPFLRDADLKQFLFALARHSDVLHMTVLTVDEIIVAWLLGTQSNGFLHLMATGFSPFHARHSPAMLHMLMLSKSLIQEQRVFDLTPGGDKYKDQLATTYENTHTLHFFPGLRAALEDRPTRVIANKALKKVMRVTVKDPALALTSSFPGRRRDRPSPESPRAEQPKVSFRLHKLNALPLEKYDERVHEVRKNKVVDLLKHEPTHSQSRREFVSQAWRFIEQGADVYTLIRDARLIAGCWIASGDRTALAESAKSGVPAGTALLLGFYVHGSEDRAKTLNLLLHKWANEAVTGTEVTEAVIGVPETDLFKGISETDGNPSKSPCIASTTMQERPESVLRAFRWSQ